MELKPLYRIGDSILIGLKVDYQAELVKDGVVLHIDLANKEIVNTPWSGQKMLKSGYYEALNDHESYNVMNEILNTFNENQIIEMKDLLLNPSKEVIESLIWVPDRLKKTNQ